jgi:hypothetical protein
MVFTWDMAVNTVKSMDEGATERSTRHPAVIALVALLLVESAALFAAAGFFVLELFIAEANSVATAIGVIVLLAGGGLWLALIARGVLRGQSWTRSAVVVAQVLLGAIAVGSFQGDDARPDLGIILFIPVVLALVLLFQKPVLAATASRDNEEYNY